MADETDSYIQDAVRVVMANKTKVNEVLLADALGDVFSLRSELAEILQESKNEREELRREREDFKKDQAETIAQIKQAAANAGVEIGKASLASANNIVKQLESVKESSLKQFNDSIRWEARQFANKEILWRTSLYAAFLGIAFAVFSYLLIPKATTDLTMRQMLETFGKKVDEPAKAKRKHH